METNKLTPEQLENWRAILFRMFGWAAFFISDDEIQKYRDTLQQHVDSLADNRFDGGPKFCECDRNWIGSTTHRDGTVTCNKCKLPRE